MNSTRGHIAASYLGKGWAILVVLAFMPLYRDVLGEEPFGLIGAFSFLQTAILLFDLGMTPTLNREMARLRGGLHTAQSIRDLLRSFEIICLALALVIVTIVIVGAPFLARHWLQPKAMSYALVGQVIAFMSVVLATRWAEQIYRGALQGLQDQIWLNGMQALLETVRWGGAFLVVRFLVPDIRAFFIWQTLASLLTVAILAWRVHRVLPPSDGRARFSTGQLRNVRRYAGGMFVSSFLAFALLQTDKVLLGRILSLADFGVYILAATAAGGILQLVAPMNAAVFPRMAEHVARGEHDALGRLFMICCQVVVALVGPVALLLAFFPEAVLLAWTGDAAVAASAASTLSLLALATLLLGVMNLPYMLQLAYGWTALVNRVNIVALVLVLPAMTIAAQRFGGAGAAAVLLCLNIGYMLVVGHLMFRRVFPELKRDWYRWVVAVPLLAGGAAGWLARLALGVPTTRLAAFLDLALCGGLLLCVMAFALPEIRGRVAMQVRRGRLKRI